jgi:hypothetical protein
VKRRVQRDFGGGMLLDAPAWAIPDGFVADATNFLFDRPPLARRRSKTIALGGLQGFSYRLGRWTDEFGNAQLYTFGRNVSGSPPTPPTATYAPAVYHLNAGVETTMGLFSAYRAGPPSFAWADPVLHAGVLMSSCYAQDNSQWNGYLGIAGAFAGSPAGAVTAPVTVTVTAGNPQIVFGGSVSNLFAPLMISIQEGATSTPFVYVGKITNWTGSTVAYVDPVPRVSFTGTVSVVTGRAQAPVTGGSGTPPDMITGKIILSWQNRLVAFNTYRSASFGVPGNAQHSPQGFWWTCGPDELPTKNPKATGIMPLHLWGWEPNNYDQIGSAYPITAAALSTNANSVLIFTERECFVLSGFLTTQSSRNAGATWDTNRLSASVGCLANNAVTETPYGVVWASKQGVYAFDGRIRPLMEDRMERAWQRIWNDHADYVLHGAAYMNGHYIVSVGNERTDGSAASQTFLCELRGRRWSRMSGTSLDVMHAVRDDTERTYALGYWNCQFDESTDVGFQRATPTIHEASAIFADDDDGGADSGGAALTASLLTGSASDDIGASKQYRSHRVGYRVEGGGGGTAATLSPQGGVDARSPTTTDASFTGTLPLPSGVTGPQVKSLQHGMIPERGFSYALAVAAGINRFELHFLETYGDEVDDLTP